MSDNKVASVYVEVSAKMDKLDKDLERAEKKVEDGFRETGKKAANALESPIVAAALKATAAFGGLELGVGGVNVAVDAMTGDIEGAAEAVKRLPAGIGPFATQLETLLGTVTGIRSEIEAWERATQSLEQAQKMRFQNSIRALQAEEKAIQSRIKVEQQIELLETTDDEKAARLQVEFDAQNRIIEAKQAAIDLDIQAQKAAADAAQDQSARSEKIVALDEDIAKIRDKIAAINKTIADEEKRSVVGTEMQLERQKELLAAKVNERAAEQSGFDAQVKSVELLQKRADLISESIPLLEKLGEAEQRAMDRSMERDRRQRFDQAGNEVSGLAFEADLATAEDPFERARMLADRRLAEREQRAKELQQIDQELAEQFRQQSERIHEAELADIERREKEKAQQERETKRREQEQTRREEIRALEASYRERERAEAAFQREQDRRRQEDVRMQQQIESTEAITRQAGQARQLRPGDRGFGSKAGTKEFDRPQKIESQTLEDIKVILERQAIAGDRFA